MCIDIKKLSNTTSFSATPLDFFNEPASITVNFYGKRTVHFSRGSIEFNAMMKRIIESTTRINFQEWEPALTLGAETTTYHEPIGEAIKNKIYRLYRESDRQIQASFITWLFAKIASFWQENPQDLYDQMNKGLGVPSRLLSEPEQC